MKKSIFYSVFALAALLLFAQSVPLEARSHHHRHYHRSTHVQVGIGAGVAPRETYIARRYVHPAVQPVYLVPAYPAPAYMYAAPVYPIYVEEVRAPEPVCRPFTFGGLSLSWNLFR